MLVLVDEPPVNNQALTRIGCRPSPSFVVMALTVALNRSGQAGKALSIGLMWAGTALVFYGLYVGGG